MRVEQSGHVTRVLEVGQPEIWEEPVTETKPFCISKMAVWKAWQRVKANQGAAGADEESIADFEANLKGNLYKIWNRMSSGSYFPPPVRLVTIPKPGGGERILGIPTVADRVAQMVAKLYLEPEVEPEFHEDSYGYRPGKSALDAVGQARRRCWRNDWALDLDIKGFFDNIDHSLMMHAVRKHTDCPWILLYIERWLKAPAIDAEGNEVPRDRGTPQGGVASPLLANIFLHHVFDKWMAENFPYIPFERYADDIVVHCRSKAQTKFIHRQIEERLRRCKLEAHPEKTKIVYCKDDDRRGSHEHERFDFLGYTFRPRPSKNRQGKFFVNFSPAMSDKAAKAARATIRSWRIQCRSDKSLEDISRMFRATLSGWLSYYGRYYKSGMYPTFRALNRRLVRWAQRKYKRYRHQRRATHWLRRIAKREPQLFPHWQLGVLP
jgi:RNA-directed DNA polymerase